MSRTRDERIAYQRGYRTGRAGAWPKEMAATVPDQNVRRLALAAQALETAADAFMACFDDRDTEPEMVKLDEARAKVRAAIASLPLLESEGAP